MKQPVPPDGAGLLLALVEVDDGLQQGDRREHQTVHLQYW